ncbi:MAG: phage holin [Tissierellia bacterium]|nr:phage holin [Tissierellia bacterium]
MKLSNQTYDVLKWFLMLVVPAFVTLLSGLGELYGFDTKIIVGTIALVATFLGTITKISDTNYKKNK